MKTTIDSHIEFCNLYNQAVEEVNYYWFFLSNFLPKRPTEKDFRRIEMATEMREMLDFPYEKISDIADANMDIVVTRDNLKKMHSNWRYNQ